MSNKLNLQIGRGNGFNDSNRYSLKFNILNNDTTTVALSALRVISYGWLPQRNILTQFTSGVNFSGNLSQFTSTIDPNYGISQNGIVNLNETNSTYRVYHNVIDSTKISPQLTINVPNGGASIGTISYINNTDSYFDIVLDSPAPTTGYSISWFLPANYVQYTGTSTPLSNPVISINKLSAEYVRNKTKKADTQFIISWPGSTNTIPQNWGTSGTDVYIGFNNLYPSNNITSAWYSKPEVNVLDNPYFVLQQFDGVDWNTVQEYETSSTIDSLTGQIPSDNTFVRMICSGVGTSSVYIGPSYSNPISANTSDQNSLFLNSKGSSDNRRRSLIQFNTSSIPSTATSIKSAVLRLNVNALQNAYNYIGTSGTVGVYQLTNSWNEKQVTWTKRTNSTSWSVSGGDYIDSPALWLGNSNLSNSFTSADNNSQFWMDFDVTSIVDYWRINPLQNYGFLVKLFDSTNENNNTNIQWVINSNKDGGNGSILGFPELLVSYNILNNQGPSPNLSIISPVNNQNIPTNTFNISVNSSIDGGDIETVDLYYKVTNTNNSFIKLGSLNKSNNNWYGTFSSIGVGYYDLIVMGVSDLGVVGQSSPITVNFTQTPSITYTSAYLCHNGSIEFRGNIDVTNSSPISGYLIYKFQDIPSDKQITKIIEDKVFPNILWISTDGNGLFRLDKSSKTVYKYNSFNTSFNIDSIVDINMESNGLMWVSIQDKNTKIGLGLISFNTLNYQNQQNTDWAYYNTTNSPLSAYSSIDIFSIEIDSNNTKWLSLNKNNINSVLSFNNFVFSSATSYNLGIYPKKIKTKNGITYVTNDNKVLIYNVVWTSATLPTFNSINSIDVDSSNNVWVGTDSGIAHIVGNTVTELQSSATPSWNTGLNFNSDKKINKKVNSVFIDDSSNKWFGFHTNNELYNGGVVNYTASTLTSGNYTNSSNWSVYDKSLYSGLLSNNVNQVIKTTDGSLCVVTDLGLFIYNNYLWSNFSETYGTTYALNISNGSLSSTIQNPIYGDPSQLNLVLDYGNGYVLTNEIDINVEKLITTNVSYPNSIFSTVSAGILSKIYSVDSNNYLDVSNGDLVTYKIYKSSNFGGPWALYKTYNNSLNPIIYDTLNSEDFFYLKTIASNNNCTFETNPISVYGRNNSILSLSPIVGNYNNNSIITVSGNVYSKDFNKNININGNVYNDMLKDVNIGYYSGSTFNSIGSAIISKIDSYNYSFKYNWVSPVVGVSSLSVISTTEFGTISTSSITFNTIQSVPTLTILNPVENQIIPFNSITILSAQGQYLTNTISAVSYHIVSGNNDITIGSATSSVGGYWTKTFIPSASFTPGNYTLYSSGIDSVNSSNISPIVNFSINNLPSVNILSNLSAIYSGSYTLQLKITDTNGFYNNRVDILSGNSIYYTGNANGFGDFQWVWNSPTNGPVILSAKIYDGNPITSSDYSIIELNFNLNSGTISLVDPGFSSAKYNGTIISPKVNVVKNSDIFNLSANVAGTNISGVNYWLMTKDYNGNFQKTQLLNSFTGTSSVYVSNVSIPSSRTLNATISNYQFYWVFAELISTNGGSLLSNSIQFYSKEQNITGGIYNSTCNNPIILVGSILDSDVPYITNSKIIDNSVSAYIYDSTNSVKLSDISLNSSIRENIEYSYNWVNPTSSTKDLKYVVTDSYGVSSIYTQHIGQIETSPTIHLNGLYGYISSGSVYVTSSTTLSISSTVSSSNVSSVWYDIYYGDGSYKKVIASSANNYTSSFYVSASQKYAIVNSELLTYGNCGSISPETYTIIALDSPSASIYYNNCSECFCSQGALTVYGTVIDNNFNNPYYSSLSSYYVSAYIYDSFNNLVGDVSNQVSSVNSNYIFTWNNPTLNSTKLTLVLKNNYGLSSSATKNFYRSISQAPTISVISPPDYSASHHIYNQNEDIVIAITNSNVSNIQIYENNNLLTNVTNPNNSNTYIWNGDKLPGYHVISIYGTDLNGCVNKVDKTILIANAPTLTFISPVNNSWVNLGSPLNVSIDTKSPATISSVNVSYDGSLISATNTYQSVWNTVITSSVSSVGHYSISAYSNDTNNLTTSGTLLVNVAYPPVFSATISGNTSASVDYSSVIKLDLSGYSSNGGYISNFYVNGNSIIANNNSATYNINTASNLFSGYNYVQISAIDNVGAISTNILTIYVSGFSGIVSYPDIKNISSNPISKIGYGELTTTFQVQDNYNGINISTIELAPGSVGKINYSEIYTPDFGRTYIVPVSTSASGNITISVSNYIGEQKTVSENGFLIRCDNTRELSLTKFIPNNLQQTSNGSNSEFYEFVEFFENYLNTMYTDVNNNCSLSVLEKTYRLQNLHDIDKIDSVYIPQFADMMGYKVGINNDELGTFGSSMVGYEDSYNQYKDKVLRFVIGNLPNWYSIKTTRNAVKLMLLSFGIIGDIIEKYTLDYDKYWKENIVSNGLFVDPNMGSQWYPTPHISVGIDLKNTPPEVVYSSQTNKVLTAMEDIRPANVVIDGVQGYAEDIQMPTCSLNISFKTRKSITVTTLQQINNR